MKKPNKYCNEDNCYTTASFNFKIDDRPIKCKKHKENNMINVKRKYIVNNNSKITYKKGYICENDKKGGSIKNNKKSKNIKIEENNINEDYQYGPDPEFTEDELKLIYADEDDNYFNVTEAVGTRKSEWNRLMIFPYYEWIEEYFGSKFNENVCLWVKIKEIKDKVEENNKKSKEIRINEIKAAKILNYDIELNKEKFNNLDWIEYKNFIIPERNRKLTFIGELKRINEYDNFIFKNLLKRDIYI